MRSHDLRRDWAPAFAGEAVMGVYALVPHPTSPYPAVEVTAEVARTPEGCFIFHFNLAGHVADIIIPDPVSYAARKNDLWQHTCFEAFVSVSASSIYTEFNFSPSTAWAGYRFDKYRGSRTSPAEIRVLPDVQCSDHAIDLWATVDVTEDATLAACMDWIVGLSAVIEAKDGTKSYWALAHVPGPPDFHNRDCWTARLPAPPS